MKRYTALWGAAALLLAITMSVTACAPPAEELIEAAPGSEQTLVGEVTVLLVLVVVGGFLVLRSLVNGVETERKPIDKSDSYYHSSEAEATRGANQALAQPLHPRAGGRIRNAFGVTPQAVAEGILRMSKMPDAGAIPWHDPLKSYNKLVGIFLDGDFQDDDGLCIVARVYEKEHETPLYGAVEVYPETLATAPLTRKLVRVFKAIHAASAAALVAMGKCGVQQALDQKLCSTATVSPEEICSIEGAVDLVVETAEHVWHAVGEVLLGHKGAFGVGAHLVLKGREGAEVAAEYIRDCSLPTFYTAKRERCASVRDYQELGPGFRSLLP